MKNGAIGQRHYCKDKRGNETERLGLTDTGWH
jgi:hypothetical protein